MVGTMGIGAISSKELTELDLQENLGELCDVQFSVINDMSEGGPWTGFIGGGGMLG